MTRSEPPEQRAPSGPITGPVSHFLNVSDEGGSEGIKEYTFALENFGKKVVKSYTLERNSFFFGGGQIFRLLCPGELEQTKSWVCDE